MVRLESWVGWLGDVELLCHSPLAWSFFVEELSGNLVGQPLVTANICRSPWPRTPQQTGTSLSELQLHPLNELEQSFLPNRSEVVIPAVTRKQEFSDLAQTWCREFGEEDIHLLGNKVSGCFFHLVSGKSVRPGKCKQLWNSFTYHWACADRTVQDKDEKLTWLDLIYDVNFHFFSSSVFLL